MTNTTLLKAKIDASGYKMKYIAAYIGLSYQGFLNKMRNKTEFTAPEIKGLCELLHITIEEKEPIFFALQVDCLPTYDLQEDAMNSDIHIHLDEISPEDTARLARGCKRLYLKIMAMPDGEAKLDAAWEAYQQRKKGENKT